MGYSNVTSDLNVYGTTSLSDLNVRGNAIHYGSLTNYGNTSLANLTTTNLTVTGNFTVSSTNTSFSNALSIVNQGTTTALYVNQDEFPVMVHNVAEFWDHTTLAMVIDGYGNVAVHTTSSPGYAFTVVQGALFDSIVTGTLSGTTLTATSISGTNFTGSTFYGGISISSPAFSGGTVTASTGFTGAAYTGGTFYGGSMTGTTVAASTGFTGAAYTGGTFYGTTANLTSSANIVSANITSSNVSGTHFGVFSGSAFTGGTFYGGAMTGTATISAATGFTGAAFTGGTFSGSTVGATSVTATNFTGTNFSGSTFTGSSFNFPSGGNITIAGSTATSGYYLQTNGTQVQWAAAASTAFTGSTVFVTGQVSIGSSFSATYPLSVNGTAGTTGSQAYSNLAYNTGGWYQAYNAGGTRPLQIYTPGNIGCAEVDLFSDERIKTNIKDSDSRADLELVSSLQPRTFRYIDPVQYGEKTYNGFIAQEVREIIPSAVNTHEGCIPDIFQVPEKVFKNSCQFKTKIEGIQVGDIVRVFDGPNELFLTVITFSDFEINFDSELKTSRVFVYGRKVKDFCTISYERIIPLLVSSIKELRAIVEKNQ